MKNNFIKKYFNQNNKIFGSILVICLMVLLVGFSYAFFVYNKTGLYTHTITGGKMSILYNEKAGNNITIDNAYPLTDKEALTKGLEFEFTITGYNESDKNIYYAIEMDYGEDVNDKERFLDSDLKLSLYENDEAVFENEVFNNLDNRGIHYGYINYGTSSESPVTNNYKLRLWINDYVIISDTISNDLSTWTDFEWDFLEEYNSSVYNSLMNSDSQDLSDFGISIYTTEEFANRYANFKVNVKADLTYDDIDFITYDANGGSFTPSKTSLTTNKITVQKPVMENKGFLGWSSKKDATVPEYLAGDYYTENGGVLYAVYGDTRNVMDYFSDTILEHVGGELVPPEPMVNYSNTNFKGNKLVEIEIDIDNVITQIYFINDTQENIDARYNVATIKDDLTLNNQGSVKAWLEVDEETLSYILYVGAEGTIYLSDADNMFTPFFTCSYINLKNVDTSMVTDMSGMFFIESSLVGPSSFNNTNVNIMPIETNDILAPKMTIDNMASLNTSNVTFMDGMFCKSYVSELDLSSFDTSNVISMSYMFSECEDLIFLDVSKFDTSNVEDMSYMFNRTIELLDLNVSNFDTSNVYKMEAMFAGTNVLILDVSNFNTKQVENMEGMFSGSNLMMLNLSNFDTSNVYNMVGMFSGCSNLFELNLSSFNTGKVTDMSHMFEGCNSLEILDVSKFDTSNVQDMSYMFSYCSGLLKLDLSHFNTSKVTNMEKFLSDTSFESIGPGVQYDANIANFDTSKVSNMISMFTSCDMITLDISHFDTSSLVYLCGDLWFYGGGFLAYCFNLENLNLGNMNTEKVINMNSMFAGCKKLQEIDLSSFNTSNVTNMYSMFSGCVMLERLDLNNFNTEKVNDMSYMFASCDNLSLLSISSFNTSNVTNMSYMFESCDKLINLDVSNFNTSKVTNMQRMFWGCYLLESLDISNFVFNFSSVSEIFASMGANIDFETKVYVKSATEQTWILNLSSSNRPSSWTTSNVIIKTNS